MKDYHQGHCSPPAIDDDYAFSKNLSKLNKLMVLSVQIMASINLHNL